MTERIYYFESLLADTEAIVTGCGFDDKKKLTFLELDRTIFFPEGGGQFCDTGMIVNVATGKEFSVVDVREDKEGRIFHYIEPGTTAGSSCGSSGYSREGADNSGVPCATKDGVNNLYSDREPPLFKPGDRVKCIIDFEKRFDRMQQHTGEHIMSGIVNKKYGYDNVGFHLGDEITTLDFNGELTKEDIDWIETAVNEAIWADVEIKSFIPSREELETLPYRSKKELEGDVRIVEIPGYDICACCAPHLPNTGRVGLVKIVDYMRHRGGMRITILAGGRALLDYRERHNEAGAISAALSQKVGTLTGGVERLLEEAKGLRESLIGLQMEGMLKGIEERKGDDVILVFGRDLNKVVVKHCLDSAIEAAGRIAGVFNGDDENGYSYSIVSETADLKALINSLNEKFPGKGGGKPGQANGHTSAPRSTIEEIII